MTGDPVIEFMHPPITSRPRLAHWIPAFAGMTVDVRRRAAARGRMVGRGGSRPAPTPPALCAPSPQHNTRHPARKRGTHTVSEQCRGDPIVSAQPGYGSRCHSGAGRSFARDDGLNGARIALRNRGGICRRVVRGPRPRLKPRANQTKSLRDYSGTTIGIAAALVPQGLCMGSARLKPRACPATPWLRQDFARPRSGSCCHSGEGRSFARDDDR